MAAIRVLVAIEPSRFSDGLRQGIESYPGAEIVGYASSPSEALVTTGELCADVVVIPGGDDQRGEPPGLCSHLFAEFPSIVVIAVAANGLSAVVYRQTVLAEKMERITSKGVTEVFDTVHTSYWA